MLPYISRTTCTQNWLRLERARLAETRCHPGLLSGLQKISGSASVSSHCAPSMPFIFELIPYFYIKPDPMTYVASNTRKYRRACNGRLEYKTPSKRCPAAAKELWRLFSGSKSGSAESLRQCSSPTNSHAAVSPWLRIERLLFSRFSRRSVRCKTVVGVFYYIVLIAMKIHLNLLGQKCEFGNTQLY